MPWCAYTLVDIWHVLPLTVNFLTLFSVASMFSLMWMGCVNIFIIYFTYFSPAAPYLSLTFLVCTTGPGSAVPKAHPRNADCPEGPHVPISALKILQGSALKAFSLPPCYPRTPLNHHPTGTSFLFLYTSP